MKNEETVTVDGCQVRIKYSDEKNPDALKQMRALLEKQRILPKKCLKI
jgi:hypothetical protein